MNLRRWAMAAGAGLASLAIWATAAPAGGPADGDAAGQAKTQPQPQSDPALERAREQVKMLDDLYKNAVVSITSTYVERQDIEPAIMVAKQVFSAMDKKGWHSARLVDATGDPMNEDNAPTSDFEKDAAQAIKSGQLYFERVIGQGETRKLQAATAVPVVMKQCAACHGRKVGDVLGFIRYEIPVK